MSIDILVISENQLPNPARWQDSLASEGSELQLPDEFCFEQFQGYVACFREGREFGFEYEYGADEDNNSCDYLMTLSVPAGSPEDRIHTAKRAALSLAVQSQGFVYMNSKRLDQR